MRFWMRAAAAGAIGLCGSASLADAANVYVSYMSLPYYEIVSLSGGRLGTKFNVYAGQQVLTVNNGTSFSPAATFTLDAWCVDFPHDIFIGANSINYTLAALTDDHLGSTPATSDPISTALAREMAGLVVYGNSLMQTAPSALNSAAVQVALWNIEYGSTYSGSDAALANKVSTLMRLAPSLSSTNGVLLDSFTANGLGYQSQSLLVSNPGSLAVPEPGTAALLLVGLLAMMPVSRGAIRASGRSVSPTLSTAPVWTEVRAGGHHSFRDTPS